MDSDDGYVDLLSFLKMPRGPPVIGIRGPPPGAIDPRGPPPTRAEWPRPPGQLNYPDFTLLCAIEYMPSVEG